MNIPSVTTEAESFNFELFSKGRQDSARMLRPPASRAVDDTATEPTSDLGEKYISTPESYEEYDAEQNLRKQFARGIGGDGSISGYDYSTNPVIGVYKEFYPGGQIKVKGLYCWFRFKIGTWYYYDEGGAVKDSVDYNEGYAFTYEQVFKFCEQRNISLEKKEGDQRTMITKVTTPEGRRLWVIQYPSRDKSATVFLQLDGNTGELIKTIEQPQIEQENPDRIA